MSVSDKISMEYESRAMINKEQYSAILKDIKNRHSFKHFVHTNLYFDRKDLFLTNHHAVLRIRKVENNSELTLKIKQHDGDMEITIDNINPKEPVQLLLSNKIKNEIEKIGVQSEDLQLVGELTTERIEVAFDTFLFVLDKNIFNNKTDYNIEIESSSKDLASSFLDVYLKKYGIVNNTAYISKSRRAIFKL